LQYPDLFSNNGVVNNAGAGYPGGSLEISKEHVEEMFAVNVHGPIFLVQETVPHMPAGGRIINITSVASKLGMDVLPIYGATKAALDSLTFAWAQEVHLAFSPPYIADDMADNLNSSDEAEALQLILLLRGL